MNNSPQVNEKGVLERMHITLQCWVILERVSVLNHFKSNFLFVTYTWLADVNASVAKCLYCFHTQSVPVFSFYASEGR